MLNRKLDPELFFPRHVGFEPVDYGKERIARKGLERLRWRLERYEPFAFSVYSGRTPVWTCVHSPLRIPPDPLLHGELEQTAILTGGDPFSPAEVVQPGVLIAIRFAGEEGEWKHPFPIPGEIGFPLERGLVVWRTGSSGHCASLRILQPQPRLRLSAASHAFELVSPLCSTRLPRRLLGQGRTSAVPSK